jgi:acyl-CoA reductase-like NAD-dependent aldehyde dehydrogenase
MAGDPYQAIAGHEPAPLAERQRRLTASAEHLGGAAEELARLITTATRKPLRLARAEVARGVGLLRATAAAAAWLAPARRELAGGGWAEIERAPLGPVLAVTPFNFPLNLALHKLAPALASGCPVLWKPSPQAPGVAEAMRALFTSAGVPAAAVAVANLSDAEVAAAAGDARLALLSFTGSVAVGRLLQEASRRARVLLELGGNAAVILHQAADPERVARVVAEAACAHAGQVCISVQRILYPQDQPAWRERLIAAFAAVPTGDPWREETVCGPVVSPRARERITALLAGLAAAGGRVLVGGGWQELVLSPTLIEGVPSAHPLVAATEAFAPLATLHPYRDLAEALAIADATPFGLQAGLFASDEAVVRQAFERLTVGTLVVNDVPSRRDDALPYGGMRDSGVGREGALEALRDYCQARVLYRPGPG